MKSCENDFYKIKIKFLVLDKYDNHHVKILQTFTKLKFISSVNYMILAHGKLYDNMLMIDDDFKKKMICLLKHGNLHF